MASMSLFLLACTFLTWPVNFTQAETLVFDSPESWRSWHMPAGLVAISPTGQLRPVEFRKDTDAVGNAADFAHPTQQRGEVTGGIWAAGSNPDQAALAIDGDEQTHWTPDLADPLKNWYIDIDLGRAVMARQIVLRFPDREGARPMRQFTVYTTTGARIQATQDIFKFDPVYRTTRPNDQTEVVIPLAYTATDSVIAVDADLGLDEAYEEQYRVIQYISLVVEEQHPQASLAEIEVLTVGDNVGSGTRQRGTFLNGTVAAAPENLFDADINTTNLITSGRGDQGWETAGTWFYVDLGAVFFIDELFIYVIRDFEGTSGNHRGSAGPGHRILYSDGTRSIGTSLPVPISLDYNELLTHVAPNADDLFRIRYKFRPRKMRYLFWHGLTDVGWLESKWGEFMLFSPGYPAEVTLTSAFIDLGEIAGDGRAKVIKHLAWDADLPAGTKLMLRSRSGNTLAPVYTFYNKIGEEVTEEKWNSSPKVLRGAIDTSLVVGEDWDAWSSAYQFSEDAFKSQSPRRYVQLEMILATDDFKSAPTVRSLSIEFDEALVSQARGRVAPLSARPNEETLFTYTLLPVSGDADSGFDLMRFDLPGQIDLGSVRVASGAGTALAATASLRRDSLLIALPATIRNDSILVSFNARLVRNATLFALDLGASDRPNLWQSVEAAERRANIVMLPELTGSTRLIDDLQFSSPVLTPNGDGVNDQIRIDFVAFKTDNIEPQIRIYDLAGRLVSRLTPDSYDGARYLFTWSGTGAGAAVVQPGIYLYRIDLGADSGNDSVLHTLSVAY